MHLEALDAERPKPDEPRNAICSGSSRSRRRRARRRRRRAGPSSRAGANGTAAAARRLRLKFIGIVDAGQSKKIVAVLSDGGALPFYGNEGDTSLGQYRILRIGAESIEMAYLDGRGRQTIRLTGS